MKHSEALAVAEALRDYLAPACVRIEIAGSIRREKPEVKDIELVCEPSMVPPGKPKLEFGKPIPPTYKTQLDELVGRMYQAGDIRIEANHLSMPEEVDFLNFLELGRIEPRERVARWKS